MYARLTKICACTGANGYLEVDSKKGRVRMEEETLLKALCIIMMVLLSINVIIHVLMFFI